MYPVLLKASSFIFIIIIGYLLKSLHIVQADAGDAVKKILIYVTLPCAIIVNFAKIERADALMLLIAISGLIVCILALGLACFFTRKSSKAVQVLYMLCMPSYNIGAFCLPFVQSFLPGLGVVAACMFDVGNSIMCTGGTYSFVAEYTSESRNKNGIDMRGIIKRLFSSPPIISYVGMFLLTVLHIRLPEAFLSLITPIADANAFVAMLMIGLLFHLEMKRSYLIDILRILAFRNVFAALLSLGIYFFLPLELVIRQALILVLFAPISAVAPAYVGLCDGDEGKASAANSLSIICSILITTILLLILGLS